VLENSTEIVLATEMHRNLKIFGNRYIVEIRMKNWISSSIEPFSEEINALLPALGILVNHLTRRERLLLEKAKRRSNC